MIKKSTVKDLGYNFVPKQYIPKGKDEYYLRNIQNRNGISYRTLSSQELKILLKNNNSSDDWSKVLVSDAFDAGLVKNCNFYGLVRIGRLEPLLLEYHDVKLPVGLYNSTIISCDFGDNVVVHNVNYMSHYIVGSEVIIVNVNELATTNHAKFGNGIIKEGETESRRIWLEVCNENAGRSILPFNGMQPGDAWLWSRCRDDEKLMKKFVAFTEKKFDRQRGYYGKIGDSTVIKNCSIIKDVWIGKEAYIKGANKLKNLTINSGPEGRSQIGEGCELVNGIIGFGCRIFYGVKAVRFFLASHSQLKYGARLINSYLGHNSTISCCEVLNSLIFPAHEQHHNNSFLCAALVMGQSNMAAGATIGSNHNSRSADGELIAGRGFWPGLCVSLKHNSKFSGFNILAKGDYPAELNIPLPFSLISNDASKDQLIVMPAYWFLYNLYALARNEHKYADRDKRSDKTPVLEYDFLAPDSVNEIFDALKILKRLTGKALAEKNRNRITEKEMILWGEALLESKEPIPADLEILADGFENSSRQVKLVKVQEAYDIYKKLVSYYGVSQILNFIQRSNLGSWNKLVELLPMKARRTAWVNAGGQLIPKPALDLLIKNIHTGKTTSWDAVHEFYHHNSRMYEDQKFQHAFASLLEITGLTIKDFNQKTFKNLLRQTLSTREWMVRGIYTSRAKDYKNPFRKMVYETRSEMDQVIGPLDENGFIRQQQKELKAFRQKINALVTRFRL